jgi:Holliday junction resolvase
MKKPKITEKEITYSIRSLLKQFGIFHFKHFGGLYAAKGVPDILGVYQGRFLGIEVKTDNGKVSQEQERFIQNINDAGGIAFVARSIDDVIAKLGLEKRMLLK